MTNADLPTYAWFTAGDPVTQGSKRLGTNQRTGNAVVIEMAGQRLKNWRAYIHHDAQQAIPEPLTGPVCLTLVFCLRRPRSARKAEHWPATRPDIDKLQRAVLDALTGVAYRDDGQVAMIIAEKAWRADGRTGVSVVVTPMGEQL